MTLKKKYSEAAFAKKVARPKREVEIFIDMDGVLSDFDTHARKKGKYAEDGSTKWNELDFDWWRTMPAYDGMKDFVKALRAVGNVSFLTAPIMSSACHHGKAVWIEKHFGHFGLKDLVICPAEMKYLMAAKNRILIDDRQKNIDEWKAAGGIGVLHKGDYAETQRVVEREVAGYIKRNTPKPRNYVDL